VKRSGSDEPMWVAIHMCLEAMLGISLYSYLHLKLAKIIFFLIIAYVFSSKKTENKRAEQVLPRSSAGWGGVWRVAQTMYTHVTKCKNDKIKQRKKR
jgi:hypothetical protein